MFDISNPQKRERLLVICAAIILVVIGIIVVRGHFPEAAKKAAIRDKLEKDIEYHQRTVRNKDDIESRLSTMEGHALAFANSEALSRYQNWLRELAQSSGIRNPSTSNPVPSGGPRGIYTKYTFTLGGIGRLDQIAEFLRRFHRTEYLHTIQSMQPRPAGTNQPDMFNVSFRIEALSLPQVSLINIPSSERDATPITEDERQMLEIIRTRAILSEYTPPPTRPTENDGPPAPPTVPFFDPPYCYVNGITESNGKPRCWIDHRTTGRMYFLFEGESFMLGGLQCTIKKIDILAQQVLVDIGGDLFVVRVGKHFDDIEPVASDEPIVSKSESEISNCFITAIAENDEGKPQCSIENRITQKTYNFTEEEAFVLAGTRCVVKKIDTESQRLQVDIAGELYFIGVGHHFDQVIPVNKPTEATMEEESDSDEMNDESNAVEDGSEAMEEAE
jgi:hypothetical protein